MSDQLEPTPLAAGDLVSYYQGGWRTGYIEVVKEHSITVRPIGPKGKTKMRLVELTTDCVKAAK